jgi:nitronate monooxygenase
MTTLTSLLGIRYPIIQAPMAGVSTPNLAAAVSDAGALGSIGLGTGVQDDSIDLAGQGYARAREMPAGQLVETLVAGMVGRY